MSVGPAPDPVPGTGRRNPGPGPAAGQGQGTGGHGQGHVTCGHAIDGHGPDPKTDGQEIRRNPGDNKKLFSFNLLLKIDNYHLLVTLICPNNRVFTSGVGNSNTL